MATVKSKYHTTSGKGYTRPARSYTAPKIYSYGGSGGLQRVMTQEEAYETARQQEEVQASTGNQITQAEAEDVLTGKARLLSVTTKPTTQQEPIQIAEVSPQRALLTAEFESSQRRLGYNIRNLRREAEISSQGSQIIVPKKKEWVGREYWVEDGKIKDRGITNITEIEVKERYADPERSILGSTTIGKVVNTAGELWQDIKLKEKRFGQKYVEPLISDQSIYKIQKKTGELLNPYTTSMFKEITTPEQKKLAAQEIGGFFGEIVRETKTKSVRIAGTLAATYFGTKAIQGGISLGGKVIGSASSKIAPLIPEVVSSSKLAGAFGIGTRATGIVLDKTLSYGVPLAYGGSVAFRVAAAPEGKRGAALGSIAVGEVLPMVVGGYLAQKPIKMPGGTQLGDIFRTSARGIKQSGKPLPELKSAPAEAVRYELPATKNFPTGRTVFVSPTGRAGPLYSNKNAVYPWASTTKQGLTDYLKGYKGGQLKKGGVFSRQYIVPEVQRKYLGLPGEVAPFPYASWEQQQVLAQYPAFEYSIPKRLSTVPPDVLYQSKAAWGLGVAEFLKKGTTIGPIQLFGSTRGMSIRFAGFGGKGESAATEYSLFGSVSAGKIQPTARRYYAKNWESIEPLYEAKIQQPFKPNPSKSYVWAGGKPVVSSTGEVLIKENIVAPVKKSTFVSPGGYKKESEVLAMPGETVAFERSTGFVKFDDRRILAKEIIFEEEAAALGSKALKSKGYRKTSVEKIRSEISSEMAPLKKVALPYESTAATYGISKISKVPKLKTSYGITSNAYRSSRLFGSGSSGFGLSRSSFAGSGSSFGISGSRSGISRSFGSGSGFSGSGFSGGSGSSGSGFGGGTSRITPFIPRTSKRISKRTTSKKERLVPFTPAYTPSIEALAFNIKGAMPTKGRQQLGTILRPITR